MNITKLTVSTKRSQLFPLYTTKYDTTTLHICLEDIIWATPAFELLGIKADGNQVRQTTNFEIVNESQVVVPLEEQFVTCEGLVELQLVIKDNSRVSTVIFKMMVTQSLESTILESHRDVKVLDDLEKYIAESRKAISEATGLAQSTANSVQAVNTQAEANELQRTQNELERKLSEELRLAAARERKSNESLRIEKESIRQAEETKRDTNEKTRSSNEATRTQNEATRELKEESRQSFERARQLSEQKRENVELTRSEAESTRSIAESTRRQDETLRNSAEATRVSNEKIRSTQESDRLASESNRVKQEDTRQSNELTRSKNEESRRSSETTREKAEAARNTQESTRQEQEITRQEQESIRQLNEESRQATNQEAISLVEELKQFESVKVTDRIDYMGNQHQSLRDTANANVDYAVKTAIGEFNYLDYEGQHITAENSIEGHARSAILSGNTLVNILPINNVKITTNTYYVSNYNCDPVPSKKYIIMYRMNRLPDLVDSNPDTRLFKFEWYNGSLSGGHLNIYNRDVTLNQHNRIMVEPFIGDVSINRFSIWCPNYISGILDMDVMMIEYQDGMENWDIPYFEGMSSVKMPVLRTFGRQLFDGELENGSFNADGTKISTNATVRSVNFTKVKPNQNIVFSNDLNYTFAIYEFDENMNFIKLSTSPKMTTTNSTKYVKFRFSEGKTENNLDVKCQIEYGTVATPHEDFKSNILTVNEPVELRGIGDVKDTLDISAGEKVECIGEIVLDGSNYDFSINNNTDTIYLVFNTQSLGIKKDGLCVCDKLPYKIGSEDMEHMRINADGNIVLWFNKSKFQEINKSFIQTYLFQNPVRVQYELAEKSIKTVDLRSVDQNGNESIYKNGAPVYSYNGTTHYSCSSEEGSLIPTLSVKVPTNLPAVIANQKATISELESENEELKNEVINLNDEQVVQDDNIVTSLLASTELFEMMLSMAPVAVNEESKILEVNPMVEVYVTLILKGEKTIEQVPAIIRDKVQAQLDLLTK